MKKAYILTVFILGLLLIPAFLGGRPVSAQPEIRDIIRNLEKIEKGARDLDREQKRSGRKIKEKIKILNNPDRLTKHILGSDYNDLRNLERKIKSRDRKIARLNKLSEEISKETDIIKLLRKMEERERVRRDLVRQFGS